ncbi:hybrid sensor histidine kinase/response regulator [Pseudomonas fluvialis]|uniref:histidine kinase n=1 Tax=Pseudomonas fluvialis TaxID=1793966 RepID=A0ABQ2AL65_9PSED|nr:hybrid sensor histidine kinase/response regulator [Pseudomonas fluvialis]GGH91848.1 hypothetical protein GCM10007363_12740 [Pseudomonas fluvialis]
MRRRLGLIISTAALFQLCFMLLDAWLLPAEIFEGSLFLRGFGLLLLALAWPLCRHPGLPPPLALHLYFLAFLGNALVVVAFIGWCYLNDLAMRYDGLFLVLLFAFLLTGLSSRNLIASAWLVCLSYVLLMLWLRGAQAELYYESQFLLCAAVIGSIGSWQQERGQRQAWLDQQLLSLARVRAEQADQRTQRLLAAASHDLRQPLNAMGLYARHLQEQASDAQTRQISQRLAVSAEQLGRMLQSLLDYTRMSLPEGGSPQWQDVQLQPLLARLMDELKVITREQQEAAELQLDCPLDYWVRSDPVRLERLLRNLLVNAWLHAQARRIWISVREEQQQLCLELGDDGRGLLEEAGQPLRSSTGLGLGLAIVRQLASQLEHALQVSSAPGQGVRYQLRLPRVAARSPETGNSQPGQLPMQVLLLEDDAASREALAGLLQRWGCQVQACANLAEARQALASQPVQLLISDYRLQDECNGLQAIERLREQAGRMLPALLVSAESSAELQERCAPAHVSLLAKPILPARLRQVLFSGLLRSA